MAADDAAPAEISAEEDTALFRATEDFSARGGPPNRQLLSLKKGEVVPAPHGGFLYLRGCPLEPIEDEAPAPRK